MNPSKFDTIVHNRAHERVNQKIIAFRAAVIKAIRELDPTIYTQFSPSNSRDSSHGWWPSECKKGDLGLILLNVSKGLTFDEKQPSQTDYPRLKWPKSLFDREAEAVTKELLATMDEMQKALCAPAPDHTTDGPADPAP